MLFIPALAIVLLMKSASSGGNRYEALRGDN